MLKHEIIPNSRWGPKDKKTTQWASTYVTIATLELQTSVLSTLAEFYLGDVT